MPPPLSPVHTVLFKVVLLPPPPPPLTCPRGWVGLGHRRRSFGGSTCTHPDAARRRGATVSFLLLFMRRACRNACCRVPYVPRAIQLHLLLSLPPPPSLLLICIRFARQITLSLSLSLAEVCFIHGRRHLATSAGQSVGRGTKGGRREAQLVPAQESRPGQFVGGGDLCSVLLLLLLAGFALIGASWALNLKESAPSSTTGGGGGLPPPPSIWAHNFHFAAINLRERDVLQSLGVRGGRGPAHSFA